MSEIKKDIKNREDLVRMLNSFYTKVFADPSINYIFIDVAKMDLEEHIPLITDFWESVLFQTGNYRRNAMQVHVKLNKKTPLKKEHFDTWLKYFRETVDEMFEGQNAFSIKERATSIATVMQIKIAQTGGSYGALGVKP